MVGGCPLIVVGWPAFTSAAVPRSMSLTWEKTPTAATTVAHRRPNTMIFRWVPRSALYIEWFIAASQASAHESQAPGESVHSNRPNWVHAKQPTRYWDSLAKCRFTKG